MPEATTVELDAQYRQLREEAGLLDRSDRGKILVSGADAAEYLQGQLTNDVEALGEGEGCYAALLDRKGHLQSDMRVLRLPDGSWLDLESAPTPTVLSHLRTYSIGREVEIADVSDEWAILALIGPRAAELAGFEGLGPEHAQRSRRWDGVDVRGVATSLGVDLIVPAGDAGTLRELALAAGAVEVGDDAAEIIRIESGIPRFGAEMNAETMPAEAGIVDAAVSFTKGCYIGQEPVARLHYKGRPNRHLRGLELSAPAEPGRELRLGDRTVGRIGSSCLSPARGPIALAIVRREAEPGAELAVGEAGVTARVVDLPFG
ncbi:MAG TPA: glycine cleavage T C-terminal barrel domain-containing protein [Solirubrobacterales bacterium]|jgi:folate-binding protein YgfZ|nr:glycine cleavage T C-terminal barrel domain-containing protein [Solirubrobacterales bacterium]